MNKKIAAAVAAVVIVGDMIPERLAQAKSFGCETIDLRSSGTLARPFNRRALALRLPLCLTAKHHKKLIRRYSCWK